MSDNNTEQGVLSNYGTPTKTQLEKINLLSKRELTKDEVFSFPTKMIGDKLIDDRYIKLHKSLLDVYKNDAKSGVSFMLDHPWAGLFSRPKAAYSYGRTYDARMKKGDIEGESWAVHGDVYMVRGKEKDGLSTDNIIADIEDGTLFDVSIGFGFSILECSICGNDIRDGSKCDHWPGRTYDIDGEEKLCYIVGKPPGYLMELSGVFDGAYDSAGILAKDGQFESSTYQSVQNYKEVKPDTPLRNVYSSLSNKLITLAKKKDLTRTKISMYQGKGGDDMTEKIKEMLNAFGVSFKEGESELKNVLDSLAEKWSEMSQTLETSTEPLKPKDEFLSKEKATEVLGKEYSADKILSLAKEGMTYREELIDDTIEWGVRAEGNSFKKDSWKQLLSEDGRTIQAIKDFRDGFKEHAEEQLPAGKKTSFGATGKDKEKGNEIPDDYYKVR